MSKMSKLVNYTVEHVSVDGLPIGYDKIRLEIKNTSTAIVNGLRRTMLDELEGFRLDGGKYSMETTDRYMVPEFVCPRISALPLRQDMDPDMQLNMSLEVRNNSLQDVLTVMSGDIAGQPTPPIFNQTFELADLQPGCMLKITDIRLERGYGRANALFQRVYMPGMVPLDMPLLNTDTIPMFESKESMVPEEVGLPPSVDLAGLSGFGMSCMLANPTHYVMTYRVVAPRGTSAGRDILTAACHRLVARMRVCAELIAAYDPNNAGHSVVKQSSFIITAAEPAGAIGVLLIRGETCTIGVLVQRTMLELFPAVQNVQWISPLHTNAVEITVRHHSADDIIQMLNETITFIIQTYTRLA